MKFLVVEDDFVSRNLLVRYLRKYGESDVAVNGREGLDIYKLEVEEKRSYDLIFLDIMTPEMDGMEFLEEIRKFEKEKGILGMNGAKIVMTTALGDMDHVKKAFRYQVESYLIKPIEVSKIEEIIKGITE
ncbi:response regulator [Haliovirga abyssi]|uniref:Response regulator n=1 Tax=Haliovirga abyssi TaxID=2996794 RepID=A0AAU9DWJ6_9FUSO|nr:response regulator [Haliovirga abyssi]BDU49625.1 response regulator [Haliovirga abyssi]